RPPGLGLVPLVLVERQGDAFDDRLRVLGRIPGRRNDGDLRQVERPRPLAALRGGAAELLGRELLLLAESGDDEPLRALRRLGDHELALLAGEVVGLGLLAEAVEVSLEDESGDGLTLGRAGDEFHALLF